MTPKLPSDYDAWTQLSTLNLTAEQELFEAVVKTVGAVLDKFPGGTYVDLSTRGAFSGWLLAKGLGGAGALRTGSSTSPLKVSSALPVAMQELKSALASAGEELTKGPWFVKEHSHECEQGLWYVCNSKGCKIATHLRNKADALLLAASHELFSQLAQVPMMPDAPAASVPGSLGSFSAQNALA